MGRHFGRLRNDQRFEQLEARRMLDAVSWNGGVTGDWDVAANWSNDAVPAPTADVTINTPSPATITIKPGDAESVNSLSVGSQDSLSIAGGSLTTATSLTNDGAITVAAGCNLTVNGNYNQLAGATLSMPGGGSTIIPSTNLATNSDFESPIATNNTTAPAYWDSSGSTYVSSQYAYTGSQSLVTSGPNSSAEQVFSVAPGASYTMSLEAMTPAADPLTGDNLGVMELLFFDSSGTLLSSYAAPNLTVILSDSVVTGGPFAGSVVDQQWNQFNTTAVAPANAAIAAAIVTTYSPTGTGGGEVCWDDVQFGPSALGPSSFVAGNICNSGAITVGPTNTITSEGNFTQASTGTLDIQLGGAPSSGDFGLVNVTGVATLAGTLQSDLVYGYAPSTTDTFTPIEFASESGTFANYSLPSNATCKFAGAVTFTNVVIQRRTRRHTDHHDRRRHEPPSRDDEFPGCQPG